VNRQLEASADDFSLTAKIRSTTLARLRVMYIVLAALGMTAQLSA
jgi:hypothetical protein